MSGDLAAVVDSVAGQVTPDESERGRLRDATGRLVDRTEDAIADLPIEADVILVGSTARETWLAGDRDVDLFVRFPADLDRADLEEYGLRVGSEVLPDGREEYAEHPYTVGEFEGFTVDLVPCYDVADATAIQSAVDRTPFHTEYLAERMDDDLAREVRVCKAFLKGIGVYGSDLRTRGFSGYLTELLVLEYGGFRELIAAAADSWHPPVEFDPEEHASESFDDPLVVIDPTDPERNVAAVCAAENVARLQHYARELLTDPSEDLFEPDESDPIDADGVSDVIDDRGTSPIAVRFDAPDVVEDQLWPQLRRSLAGLTSELDRRGFDVLRAATFADETAVLLAELAVAERPAIERHEGPPVHVRNHAEGFHEKYAKTDAYGPFVEEDRYVVEREREFTTAAEFLDSDAILDVALGARIEEMFDAGSYDVLIGDDIGRLADEFGTELARYFDPKP